MATTKYSVRVDTTSNFIADIKAALNAKSLITSVLAEAATYLIFSTPLSTKIIKIDVSALNSVVFIFADSWTSGSTVVNGSQFCRVGLAMSSAIFFADTTFFLFVGILSTSAFVAYCGEMDDGTTIAFGGCTSSSNTQYAQQYAYVVATSAGVGLIGIDSSYGFADASGKLLTMPMMITSTTGTLIMNSTVPAALSGVKISSSIFCTGANVYDGSTYVIIPSPLYRAGGLTLKSNLIVEYTP